MADRTDLPGLWRELPPGCPAASARAACSGRGSTATPWTTPGAGGPGATVALRRPAAASWTRSPPRSARCPASCSATPSRARSRRRRQAVVARDARPADRPAGCSSSARSPAAAWAPSSRAATPTSAATWPSRSCSSSTATTPTWSAGSSRRRRSAASSSTPGVVPVYELGHFADRRPYFAMKLVKGRTLAEAARRRDRPGRTTCRASWRSSRQVCQTVAYAHARGVIHRDLKPSNVMVGSFGEVQVMDWGLAKVLPRGGVVDDATAGKPGATRRSSPRRGAAVGRRPVARRLGDGHAGVHGARAGPGRGRAARRAGRRLRAGLDPLRGPHRPAGVHRAGRRRRSSGKAARGDLADALARLDACGADAELVALAQDCLAPEPEDRPRDAGGGGRTG